MTFLLQKLSKNSSIKKQDFKNLKFKFLYYKTFCKIREIHSKKFYVKIKIEKVIT